MATSSSMLTLIHTFCLRTGLPAPNIAAGSQDHQILQLVAILNEALEDIVDRWDWTDLQYEATFTTVAAEDQGAVAAIAPNGFLRIFNETIFNRTLRLPLFGPMRKEQWQALKALPTTGPFYKYRILRGRILFNPAGVAGQLCAFEYQSSWAVTAQGNTAPNKSTFTADTDVCVFDDKVILAALQWKWLLRKGLDYAEEFRRYEMLGNNAAGRDTPHARVDLSGSSSQMIPGIWVTPGNWPLVN